MGRTRKPTAPTAAAPANDDAPFPDDEPKPEEQPAELAHALVGPDRVDNYDRLARQREAFGDVSSPQSPAPPAPAQPARRPAPRRVSAEVVKAETALLNLERRRKDSLAHAETVWAQKRLALIRSFPADVLGALEAMKVLDWIELEGLEP